ncbi:MAG: hypothetical protein Q7S88_01095 [Candidatus Daviesbacteria bacterium]|nr:hypothetical protein [Candidatus Daviesbacteria bacterium]
MMTTSLNIYKYILLTLVGVTFLSLVAVVQAQEAPEEAAKKFDVSFPVEALGGCQDYSTCRTFCEDPVNSTACVSFAKEKGFYKEDLVVTQGEKILEKAKTEVGCGTQAECKAFCEVPTNYPTCASFAQKSGLRGGYIASPEDQNIVNKAKEVLGCSSPTECASLCSNPDNRDKCSGFAKQVGIRGGQESRGPGGCTSGETCKAYCSDPGNYQQCSNFAGGEGQFKGPGGCTSQDSCQNFCEQNPAQCKMISSDPNGGPGLIDNPQKAAAEFKKYCDANSENCASKGNGFFSNKDARLEFEQFCSANPESCGAKTHFNQVQPTNRKAEFEDLCKSNPSGCETGPGGYSIPKGTASGGFIDPREYCRRDPSRCPNEQRFGERFASTNSYDPVTTCNNTTSCGWENGSCRCGENRSSEGGDSRGSRQCSAAVPTNGCGPNSWWDFGSCSCRNASGAGPGGASGGGSPVEGCSRAGGSWMGSYCKMPNSGTSGNGQQGNPGSPGREQQEAACKSGGGRCTGWYNNACSCERSGSGSNPNYSQPTGPSGKYTSGGQPGGPGAPYPGQSSAGSGRYGGGYDASGKYVGGDYGGYDSAGNNVGTGNDPGAGCRSAGGSWNNGSCQMPQSGTSGGSQSDSGTMSPADGCAKAGGSWNGSSCSMPSTGTSGGDSSTAPTSAPAPATEQSAPPPPSGTVQGISTGLNALEQLLNFLFR